MEAIGAAASVAGLISLATQIPKLIDTALTIRAAPDEAKQLSQTADSLVLVLTKLEAFLKTDEARDMKLADDSGLLVSISACQRRIVDLSKKLHSQSPQQGSGSKTQGKSSLKSKFARFEWPFVKTECLQITAELHAMQSTFEFCLVMKNCQQMARSHKEVIAHFETQQRTLCEMRSSFPDMAAGVDDMLDKLRVVSSCTAEAARNIDRVQIGLEELQEMRRDLAEYHADKLQGQALEWLSPLDPSSRHDELRETRLRGTCDKFIDREDFQQWVREPPSKVYAGVNCWVGAPGQGKTYTMSRIVDYLQYEHARGTDTYVTYFYCDYQRTRDYSTTSLLGAMVRQLLGQFDQAPTEISEIVRHCHTKLRRAHAKREEIFQILALLQPYIRRLYVCIDALDECKDAWGLIKACKDFPLSTSFAFIGRPSISRLIKRAFDMSVHLEMEPQQDDVYAVVAAQVEEEKMRQPDLMSYSLEVQIRDEVSKLANGMFLLASLHTTLVLSHDTIHRRREALKNLPDTLDATFGQTLARIREQKNAQRAFQVLAWIHFAGTLSMEQLQHALAVEPHHEHFVKDNLPNSGNVLDCCLGLIRLGSQARSDTFKEVALVHSTLSVYFDSRPEIFWESTTTMARVCLRYLSFDLSAQPAIIRSLMTDSWLPLMYASKHIPRELQERAWEYCSTLNSRINSKEVKREMTEAGADDETQGFIDTLPRHAREIATKNVPPAIGVYRSRKQSMLETACMLGLDGLDIFFDKLLELDRPKSGRYDPWGMTALGWTLLPDDHFDRYHSVRPGGYNSFEKCVLRARELLVALGIDPNGHLWDVGALAAIQGSGSTESRNGVAVQYLSRYPFLFFLANQNAYPEEMHRCILLTTSQINLDVWANMHRSSTDGALQASNPESQSWTLLILDDHAEMKDAFDENNAMSTMAVAQPSGSFDILEFARIGDTTTVAVFEPGSKVPTVVDKGRAQRSFETYAKTRTDITTLKLEVLPGTMCLRMHLSREALLHVGAVGGCDAIVSYALNHFNLDPSIGDQQGQTAMHLALRYQRMTLCLLSHHRLDVNLQDHMGMSIIHVAAQQGLAGTVAGFLDFKGAKVNLQDVSGNTPLHYAAETQSRSTVSLLLKRGADVNIEDITGRTPLHVAIAKRDAVICDIILEPRKSSSFTAENLHRAWHLATEAGAKFIMSLLHTLRSKRQTLLLAGSPGSSSDMVRSWGTLQLFLSAEGDSAFGEGDLDYMIKLTRAPETPGETAIVLRDGANSIVSCENAPETIRDAIVRKAGNIAVFLLGRLSANLDNLGEDGESALHLAVVHNTPQVVEFLLRQGNVDLASVDPLGYTALQLSLIHKRLEILQLLLSSPNVDVGRVHKDGSTALHFAMKYRFWEAVHLLLPFAEIPINHLDASGRTVMHYAVMNGDVKLVREILKCPNLAAATPSADGRTALAYAAFYSGEEMISLLMETGKFDIDHKDSYGKTALDWAKQNSCKFVVKRR